MAGIPELREAICSLHERYDRLTGLHPEQVLVGPGTKELIFLLLNIYYGGEFAGWMGTLAVNTLARRCSFNKHRAVGLVLSSTVLLAPHCSGSRTDGPGWRLATGQTAGMIVCVYLL